MKNTNTTVTLCKAVNNQNEYLQAMKRAKKRKMPARQGYFIDEYLKKPTTKNMQHAAFLYTSAVVKVKRQYASGTNIQYWYNITRDLQKGKNDYSFFDVAGDLFQVACTAIIELSTENIQNSAADKYIYSKLNNYIYSNGKHQANEKSYNATISGIDKGSPVELCEYIGSIDPLYSNIIIQEFMQKLSDIEYEALKYLLEGHNWSEYGRDFMQPKKEIEKTKRSIRMAAEKYGFRKRLLQLEGARGQLYYSGSDAL